MFIYLLETVTDYSSKEICYFNCKYKIHVLIELHLLTGTPGRNFRQLGFGVSWVWI